MLCHICGGETKVEKTGTGVDVIFRRRRCLDCRAVFITEERSASRPPDRPAETREAPAPAAPRTW